MRQCFQMLSVGILAILSFAACSGQTVADDASPGGGTDAAADSTTVVPDGGSGPDAEVEAGADAKPPLDAAKDRHVADVVNPPLDSGPPDGVQCGAVKCKVGELCCANTDGGASLSCATTCATGGLSCDGPEDCGGNICCGLLDVSAGSPPNCPINKVSATCGTSCASQIALSCPATNTVRMCHASAECASDSSGYTKCCTFDYQGASTSICVSPLFAFAAKSCN